jgi:hypothetical protein
MSPGTRMVTTERRGSRMSIGVCVCLSMATPMSLTLGAVQRYRAEV